ncbi:phosphopentomutase [Hathewaya histolytica]|uniref:Phosphopentomutase n=1 Tax=Hathewaya histolytica TaxID=1498 RepID=A0A4U9RYY0_HATHI|nr:phosphopentomutase [Hathewaya histolytica]VTQ94420.1 Phosphopentomutase [Hathewaya histolytica]
MKRVILLVIDSLGIGEMEDIKINRPIDVGSNTLKHILENNKELSINNLIKLGLINALGEEVGDYKKVSNAIYGEANLTHPGADSFYGHYEIAGAKIENPVVYPLEHYIDSIKFRLEKLGYGVEKVTKFQSSYLFVDEGIFVCDNIEAEYGNVYSVIGSNEKVDYNKVKLIAKEVRNITKVSRVVSVITKVTVEELTRCIEIKEGKYIGINSPKCNLYNREYEVEHLGYGINNQGHCITKLKKINVPVISIGKVSDIIDVDVDKRIYGVNTNLIIENSLEQIKSLDYGFIFINIQETDLAGHLEDVKMYGKQLEKVDKFIGEIINLIGGDDFLIVMADHGNDPTIGHSKHTRERVPILIYNKCMHGEIYLGTRKTMSDVGATIVEIFNGERTEVGESFFSKLKI